MRKCFEGYGNGNGTRLSSHRHRRNFTDTWAGQKNLSGLALTPEIMSYGILVAGVKVALTRTALSVSSTHGGLASRARNANAISRAFTTKIAIAGTHPPKASRAPNATNQIMIANANDLTGNGAA
jgi:hypothetical protein